LLPFGYRIEWIDERGLAPSDISVLVSGWFSNCDYRRQSDVFRVTLAEVAVEP